MISEISEKPFWMKEDLKKKLPLVLNGQVLLEKALHHVISPSVVMT